jgi:hypothetical protein
MRGARWLTLGLCGLLFAAPPAPASAEPKSGKVAGRQPRKARPKASAKKSRKARPKRETQQEPTREATASSESEAKRAEHTAGETRAREPSALTPAQKAAQDAAQGANAEIVREGDTSVKVMSFSGLDIEGRLKSPQLLYFVNRVHAEFDRPKLPHRSFMPELERSTEREPVR